MRIEKDGIVVFENLARRDDDLVGQTKNVKIRLEPFVNPNAPGDFHDNNSESLEAFHAIGKSIGDYSKHFTARP